MSRKYQAQYMVYLAKIWIKLQKKIDIEISCKGKIK